MNGWAVVREDPDYANIAVFTDTQADAEQWAAELNAASSGGYQVVLVDGVCTWCHQAPVEEDEAFCGDACYGMWVAFRTRQEDFEALELACEVGS